ncbi:phosphonate C-P lyase system protein PhnH [Cohnella zeiphila]|uniref:Phosphonate C-P lyase system protein PhnH n=1 Tax=Cohnella zeiphila TaxID=2761120 RepID=A0A7X0VY84_9BACL|nr:phosphonate C-P lyase system protein PhnH [Cohnella zeiphila]MBB6735099.1 phosphonate C-P lyase system protein PhnH [Cohnella zeiphila]
MSAIDNSFSMTHDTQFVYRLLLELTARPGEVGSIRQAADKIGLLPGAGDVALAVAYTLLDSEVGCFADVERLPELAGVIRLRTLSRSAGASAADYLFADGTQAPGEWAGSVRRGTLGEPEMGATVLLLVDALEAESRSSAGEQPEGNAVRLMMTGPGIEEEHRLLVGGLDPRWLACREGWNEEYPTGVDLILYTPGGEVAAIPRSTQLKGA